mgnify:CR=1 FL=1
MVVDLATTVRPGQHGYPLNAARDGLQDRARWVFNDLFEEVERENESVGRSMENEVYDPDSDDERERRGAAELADLAAEAFADEAFQKALAEAAGGIADYSPPFGHPVEHAKVFGLPGYECPRVRLGRGRNSHVQILPDRAWFATGTPAPKCRKAIAHRRRCARPTRQGGVNESDELRRPRGPDLARRTS